MTRSSGLQGVRVGRGRRCWRGTRGAHSGKQHCSQEITGATAFLHLSCLQRHMQAQGVRGGTAWGGWVRSQPWRVRHDQHPRGRWRPRTLV